MTTGSVRLHDSLTHLLVAADQVRPSPTNPRNGDTDAIVASMRRNGIFRPVYAQRSTGHILAGNHTYAAMIELGADEIPVIWLDVDDEHASRILLVDNRSADLGQYDDGLLVSVLQSLPDLDGTGYTDEYLAELVAAINGVPDDEDTRVTICLKVPPEVAAQWVAAGLASGIDDPTMRDSYLIGLVSTAVRSVVA